MSNTNDPEEWIRWMLKGWQPVALVKAEIEAEPVPIIGIYGEVERRMPPNTATVRLELQCVRRLNADDQATDSPQLSPGKKLLDG